jgi:hypothetical protein
VSGRFLLGLEIRPLTQAVLTCLSNQTRINADATDRARIK